MKKPKNFVLLGVAGYIAPRHLKAIKETGNNLVAAMDPHDSVGILDSYFFDSSFFTEFERLERFVEKQRIENSPNKIDYVSICTPNYLHDAHIRFALRMGADVICEKPLVINPWNLESLADFEKEQNKRSKTMKHKEGPKINTVLQLRLHPSIVALREKIKKSKKKHHDIELTYVTPRGLWFDYSWRGDVPKAGGIIIEIGIHFFDMLLWIFGDVKSFEVYENNNRRAMGSLKLERGNVKWFLSIDKEDLPGKEINKDNKPYRSIKIDGEELEFSEGFTDLHTKVYQNVLEGKGFKLEDVRPSVYLVYDLRNIDMVDVPKDPFFDKYKRN